MSTLYHHPMSAASRFIRLVIGEYAFEVDMIEERPWEKRKAFLTANPAGTLPVYVDDNMRALCGPFVIAEFMDETHGVLQRERRLLAERDHLAQESPQGRCLGVAFECASPAADSFSAGVADPNKYRRL